MKIRVLGGGWYGCYLTLALLEDGHNVELHEIADRLFSGASGANPARLHQGAHYPRSKLTRAHCQENYDEFMYRFGSLTRCVPINIYAVARDESLVDFGTYRQVLEGEIDLIPVFDPAEFGLRHVEGAILTGERHIVIDDAREYFQRALGDTVHFNRQAVFDDVDFDLTIDCTFCSRDSINVDRYEPCVTTILSGPVERAVTIMDGPFPSLYPWDESRGLCSLTSARFTPIAKCRTHAEAVNVLKTTPAADIDARAEAMLEQMAHFYPRILDTHHIVDCKLGIRAMPASGSAARLVDVVPVGNRAIRVRAGKIDAIFHAEAIVKEMIAKCRSETKGLWLEAQASARA